MFVGALFVGIHMATTHGVTLAMMSSYIPTTQVAGIGKISGTAWSLTDFIFGEPHPSPTPFPTRRAMPAPSFGNGCVRIASLAGF
jgi:hypothetical protein